MTRDEDTIDDMAATLLEIHHIAPSNDVGHCIKIAVNNAIDRWKAGKPWPRLNDPNPPPRPNLEEV